MVTAKMSTTSHTHASPDLVFGPSEGTEGFMVLHVDPSVTEEQKRTFDSTCRRMNWVPTPETPEKLHALACISSKESKLLLHVRQKMDNKQRRALWVEGYLFPLQDGHKLLEKAQSLTYENGMQLVDATAEIIANNDTSPVIITQTDLIRIAASSPEPAVTVSKSTSKTPPPTQSSKATPSKPPQAQSTHKTMKATLFILGILIGLGIGISGAYYSTIQPLTAEANELTTRSEALKDSVDQLTSENKALEQNNSDLSAKLTIAKKQIESQGKHIHILESELPSDELTLRKIINTDQERADLATSATENAAKLRELAEQYTEIAEELQRPARQ
jgi:prefoldin subunit 5